MRHGRFVERLGQKMAIVWFGLDTVFEHKATLSSVSSTI